MSVRHEIHDTEAGNKTRNISQGKLIKDIVS